MSLSPEARSLLRQARALKSLTEYPEWKVFFDLINANAENYGSQSVGQSTSIDALVAKEFPKGVLYGLRLALSLPSAMWEQRAEILAREPLNPEEVEAAESDLNIGKAP